MTQRQWVVCGLALAGFGQAVADDAPVRPASADALEAEVVAALDRSVDPCTDFYQFACGGWLKTTQLPADRPVYGRGFSTIQDRNQAVVRDILEHPPEGTDTRLGAFYQSCTDEAAVEAAGDASLKADLAKIDAAKDVTELVRAVAGTPVSGALFGLFVDADFENPDVNVLHVVQGGTGLPEKSYYAPKDAKGKALLADYQAHVGRMLALAGRDAAQAKAVVAIETKLAKASRAAAELRDVVALHHPTKLVDLEARSPAIPWGALLETIGAHDVTDLNVMTPEFFPAASKVLAKTPLADLKAYAAWHLVHATAAFLPAAYEKESFAFWGTRLSGTKEQKPRWKRCVDATDGGLGDLLGKAFVDRAFAGDSKPKAEAMIREIQAAFEAGLPALAWMDDATRARAKEKLLAISDKIGFPDKWETYDGLVVGPTYYDNAIAVAAWDLADHVKRIGKPVDKSEWGMTPPTVNAYYNGQWNEIVFPAGILQPPFFSASYPAAMNYGAIGMVVGHEITHGFDDEGRKFGPSGKLEEWWAPEVSKRFEDTAQCIVDTYGAIEVQPGVKLNGALTEGENIADFGGIKLATDAYARFRREGGQDWTVADFTPEQLLYVGYAQSWCSLATPEVEALRARTDPHSPPRQRVNVPLANLPAFSEAFHCPADAKMHVQPACSVW